jgi:acyl-CoA reductase-like NAD-dependent aldehyde dehydrogenase
MSETSKDAGARVRVAKAYKMYVGGHLVRSESGRYFQSEGHGELADPSRVNVPLGSRKDVRDAVRAAKSAQPGWAAKTAYNRGQILYRFAEMLEARRGEIALSLVRGGEAPGVAESEVDRAVDRTIFYAGFCDKFQALLASSNPVTGPYFCFSVPEPMGVVGIVSSSRPAILGLVSTVFPVILGGNTCVVLASEADPCTPLVLCEVFATSDIPGGVVNVLTGRAGEMAPHLATHREVNALDVWSADAALRAAVESDASSSVKRVRAGEPLSLEGWCDERIGQGIGWIEKFVETKSVWHPIGT